jgi:hypothetical protein
MRGKMLNIHFQDDVGKKKGGRERGGWNHCVKYEEEGSRTIETILT